MATKSASRATPGNPDYATGGRPMSYGKGNLAPKSDIGPSQGDSVPQFTTHHYDRAALVEALDELRFTQMADSFTMPKHQGKEIKRYRYFRLLDKRNINNQGIGPDGVKTTDGNLYGSSRDMETITSKIPMLTEDGGRVNRVGQSRLDMKGSFQNMGFFQEYSADSLDFDTDAGLYGHYTREMMRAAVEIYEDMLAIDMINFAGTVVTAGSANLDLTDLTGEGANISLVDYADLKKLNRLLDIAKAKRTGKILSGSRMQDTRTLNNLRVIYVGYDLQPVLEDMLDNHGEKAFVGIEQYADQTAIMAGEIGSVAGFRVVIAPRMPKHAGKGASATAANAGYQVTNSKYDAFPMLVVAPESFTTVGFHSSSTGSQKFNFKQKKPGEIRFEDPFGKKGIMSLEWWYGFMGYEPTHMGLIWTVAPL